MHGSRHGWGRCVPSYANPPLVFRSPSSAPDYIDAVFLSCISTGTYRLKFPTFLLRCIHLQIGRPIAITKRYQAQRFANHNPISYTPEQVSSSKHQFFTAYQHHRSQYRYLSPTILVNTIPYKHKSFIMLASRAMKPKLSLNIAPAASQSTRPVLSLRSPVTPTPMTPLRSPMMPPPSPLPMSPTSRNTKLNQRGFATIAQQPTYTYTNSSTARSILKKTQNATSRTRQLQFSEDPVVYSISPIEEPEYYGGYKKLSKEERRWMVRS